MEEKKEWILNGGQAKIRWLFYKTEWLDYKLEVKKKITSADTSSVLER